MKTTKKLRYTRNGFVSDNQKRQAARLPKDPLGFIHCPGWDDGRPCTSGKDANGKDNGKPYKHKNASGMSAHRRAKHGYGSPMAYGKKDKTAIVEVTGERNTAYYDPETKRLIPDAKGVFHCPEFLMKTGKPCKFTHSRPTSTGWHRKNVHGIAGPNAHRPKKKLPVLAAEPPRKTRKPWGSNRIAERVMQENAELKRQSQLEQPPQVILAGVDGCPRCRLDLRPYNQLAAASQMAKDTGDELEFKTTITPKHHGR